MSIIDIVSCIFIILATLHGMIRGLSGELASLISIIISFVAGILLQPQLTTWFSNNTSLSPSSAHVISFTVIVVTVFIILIIIRHFLKKIIEIVIDEKYDRFLGLISGFIRAIIIVVIVFIIMNLVPHDYLNKKFGDESVIGSYIKPHIPYIAEQAEKAKKKL